VFLTTKPFSPKQVGKARVKTQHELPTKKGKERQKFM
jgi:hypothetical protein